MSGFAAVNGEAGGQPMLPAIALTDELTGLVGAFATMVALHSGVGQVVDTSLLESVFHVMGPVASLYALTGELQPRLGSGLPYTVPRGTYQCADGSWVGISASSDSVAMRVMGILGVADDPRFGSFDGRTANRDEIEALMRNYCAGRRRDEVIAEFEKAEAAIGPVLDMADIARDPHFAARSAITMVGDTPMQNLIARLSATPGELRHEGRALDADGESIRTRGWETLT
jgi:crotonobetainyl-CoA:carnitine CoA-transferase CaiB-like acyl-CoA transferase